MIVFEKKVDPRTGIEFYYNRRTGESQWDAPLLAKKLVGAQLVHRGNPSFTPNVCCYVSVIRCENVNL